MALNFPEAKDVRLLNPPLTEVICQVRYPPILRIAKGQPVEFQEDIRHRFTEFIEESNVQIRLGAGGSNEVFEQDASRRQFEFLTQKADVRLGLTIDSYALSTNTYNVWGDFESDLQLVHDAMVRHYRPSYLRRVGLRYINHLSPELTGVKTLKGLLALLHPEVNALVSTSAWDEASQGSIQLLLDGTGEEKLLLRIVWGEQENSPSVFLDFDYYDEDSVPVEGLVDRCRQFHDNIYRAFRWCLEPSGFSVFQPNKPGA